MKTLYLIPTWLAEGASGTLSADTLKQLGRIKSFVVENTRTTRRFISGLKLGVVIDELDFYELDADNNGVTLDFFLRNAPNDVGLLSEAGCPAIADPGHSVVQLVQRLGWVVCPLAGPCSFIMALMASGFNGQQFTFHAYLPIEKQKRSLMLKEFEKQTQKTAYSQIFMDTPYRNDALLSAILESCSPQTMLCIAANMSAENAWIKTASLAYWRKNIPQLAKIPVVFILGK